MARTRLFALCHPTRPHEARGLCHACYTGAFRRYKHLGETPEEAIRFVRTRLDAREMPSGLEPYRSRLSGRLIRPHPDLRIAAQRDPRPPRPAPPPSPPPSRSRLRGRLIRVWPKLDPDERKERWRQARRKVFRALSTQNPAPPGLF